MKGILTRLAAIGMTALAGCSPAQWTRPNTDSAQFERDKAECLYEGNKATATDPNVFAGLMANNLASQCLQLRGYSQTRGDDMAEARRQAAANEKLHPIADQKAQQLRDLQANQ